MNWVCGILTALLLMVIALWVLIEIARRYFHVPYPESERHWAETVDGFRLALYRRRPEKQLFALPIVLCHGLGANRYDLDWPQCSLARYLCDAGFDVWVCELRNAGQSDKPRLWNRLSGRYSFDDLEQKDVPAIIGKVLEVTGAPQLLWTGHSMGGMLAYAYLGRGGDKIAAAVAIASPAYFDGYDWARPMFGMVKRTSWLPMYNQVFAAPLLALCLDFFIPELLRRSASLENLGRYAARRMIVNVAANVSTPLGRQFVHWIESGRFDSFDGKTNHHDNFSRIRTPFAFISSTGDGLVSPEGVQKICDSISSTVKVHRIYGKQFGGLCDYGHGDLVLTENSRKEVFPFIRDFLKEHTP